MSTASMRARRNAQESTLRQRASFLLPHQISLHAFHASLTNPEIDLDDREIFCSVVREAVNHFGVSAQAIADELNVSLSTVNRWSNDKSSPHILVRKVVHANVVRQIEKNIRECKFVKQPNAIEGIAADALSKSLATI